MGIWNNDWNYNMFFTDLSHNFFKHISFISLSFSESDRNSKWGCTHTFLQIELGNCKTWIVKLCDNTLILTFFVAKNLTNGMFYMFLTIIWLIYHCSSFQDQHLTFFAPNLGPNLIHSFNVCEQDITITAITDITDTQIFLPQQRFPNLANKSLCYNVMTISLFASAAQGGAHIAATRGGTKRALAWPGLRWCLLPSSDVRLATPVGSCQSQPRAST